jgi:hypothetical protein
MIGAKVVFGDGDTAVAVEIEGEVVRVRSMEVVLVEEDLVSAYPKLDFIARASDLAADALGIRIPRGDDE